MMSYIGSNLAEDYDMFRSFEDYKLFGRQHSKLAKLAMDLVSQFEVLHDLGLVHGDLKFQNICYNPTFNLYSIIDFGLVTRIFH